MPDAKYPPPAEGEEFQVLVEGPRVHRRVVALVLGVARQDSYLSWLVRADDGELWKLTLADRSLVPGTRLWGRPHRASDG